MHMLVAWVMQVTLQHRYISLPTISTTTPTASPSLPTIPTTTPTIIPSPSAIITPISSPPCMHSTVSNDTCEPPQGDNIAISTYIIIIVSVVSFLFVLTTVLSVLLWLSRRKREPEQVENVSYHSHTIEMKTGAITAPPPEVSVATSMATPVPQSPGESGDIATAANVAYEPIGLDIVMSVATSMPTPPNPVPRESGDIATATNVAYAATYHDNGTSAATSMSIYSSPVPQPPVESDGIATAANVAYAATDTAKYYVNPAYQPLQNGSDNNDYMLCYR